MPITQDRIHDLIRAAETALEAFDAMQGLFKLEYERAKRGEQTFEQAFSNVTNHVAGLTPYKAMVMVGQERWRYNLTHAKNTRDKERRKRERSMGGPIRGGVYLHYQDHLTAKKKLTPAEVAAKLEREEGPALDVSQAGADASLEMTDAQAEAVLATMPQEIKDQLDLEERQQRYMRVHGNPAPDELK